MGRGSWLGSWPSAHGQGGSNGLQWGKIGKIIYAILGHVFGCFYETYVEIIGLKAPGNYLDQFWPNKVLALLCEETKPNISMISGFLSPGEPLFCD